MDFIINTIKSLLATNAARVIGYGGALALTAASALADALGVELPPEVITGVQAAGVLIVTELIRRFVYAPATVQKIADRAADTGDTDIGNPPEGE